MELSAGFWDRWLNIHVLHAGQWYLSLCLGVWPQHVFLDRQTFCVAFLCFITCGMPFCTHYFARTRALLHTTYLPLALALFPHPHLAFPLHSHFHTSFLGYKLRMETGPDRTGQLRRSGSCAVGDRTFSSLLPLPPTCHLPTPSQTDNCPNILILKTGLLCKTFLPPFDKKTFSLHFSHCVSCLWTGWDPGQTVTLWRELHSQT